MLKQNDAKQQRICMLSLAYVFQAEVMSSWGNYVVPVFFQQDIIVEYLAATTHYHAAAPLFCLSQPLSNSA